MTPCACAAALQIVTSAIETQNVVATCAGSELMKNMLPHLLEQLELCQKSLSAYLETKRAEFPRCAARFLSGRPHSSRMLSVRWKRTGC